ncbi:MAG: MFS transporter [Acidimicrobiales bacterium]
MTSTAIPTGAAPPAPPARRRVPLSLLVVAGGVITAASLGARSTFGLFLDPVVTTIGTGRATFALAVAIQNLAWGLSQPFAGAIADRFGTAKVLSAGAVVYALGLVMLSQATSAGGVYLSIGLVVGIGTGAASFAVVLSAVGRMAPPHRRSMALGVASAMGSVGQLTLIPLFRYLIDSIGWQDAALWLGAIVLSVIVFAPLLRGRSAEQAAQAVSAEQAALAAAAPKVPLRHELRRAAHSRAFLLLNLGFFVCGFHVTFVGTHLASYAVDVGQPRSVAATALAVIGLFNIFGSLLAGALGARYAKRKLLSIIYGTRAVVFALFMVMPHTTTSFLVFGAAMGVLWLSTVPLTSGIVASQFGTAHAGTLFGIVFLSHQLGAFVGAWMGGTLADRLHSYNPVWWIGVGLGVMAAIVHLLIDEGPQPDVPAAPEGRLATRPAFGAAVVVGGLSLAGVIGALHATATAAETAGGGSPAAVFCPLHVMTG